MPPSFAEPRVETSPPVADEVKTTTCYMCACRCGVRVHLRDGEVRYIDGNPEHPVNRGVICGKGSAGIMKQHSPAKLRKPLLRVGERGSGEFREIEWDQALDMLAERLAGIRATDPRRLAFFTGRDQSQALTGWWATQFGTPNYAAHGGFCSVNMAAGGLYSVGGSFWEFGEPDWDHTKLFLMFGVAEDHDSNPIKIGLSKLKARAARFVSINPVKTGYSAIADEWVGIRPGTDGLLVMALIHELLHAEQVDFDYLARYTNAPWLVIEAPGSADDGLFARDDGGRPLAFDAQTGSVVNALEAGIAPRLTGAVELADGRRAVPSFELLARRYMDAEYAPERAAAVTGVPVETIRGLASELARVAFSESIELPVPWTDWAGRRHETMVGRPVSFHAMRGISAHSNGFHTCRALHLLQMLLGAIDTPGSFRYKPPFPRPIPPAQLPAGHPAQVQPGSTLGGPPLGFPTDPAHLLLDDDGVPMRIDKAYSWEAPLAAHGAMHMVIRNAVAGDPYPIDTLFMYMANMAWNSSMNTAGTMDLLRARDDSGEYRIPFIVYSDAFWSETVAFADLVLPDTTYLERYDAISMLDRPISTADGPCDAIRQPVLEPDRDVRCFQSVLLDLGARLRLPGMADERGAPLYAGGYADYIVNHERKPGVGTLAGWRGADGDEQGTGAPNARQLERYIENGCFWHDELPESARYYKHANRDYLEYAADMAFIGAAEPVVLQLYSEPLQRFRLAAQGHGERQPPAALRQRVETYFDPLPIWYAPFEEAGVDTGSFTLHAITQRPMVMYHAWDSQNAWQRQILGRNRLYMHPDTAAQFGLGDDDWVWVESHHGQVKGQVRLMDGVNPHTVWTWNAIGKRAGAWNLDPAAPEARQGFLLNHLISELLPQGTGDARLSNSDPVTGQAAWYDLRVRLRKAAPHEEGESAPQFSALKPAPGLPPRPARLQRGQRFRRT